MKANELMIGDWVKIKTYGVSDKYEKTEAYIYVEVAEIGSGLITIEYNNEIKEPHRICEYTEIEPIPLTLEILEKNGFVVESRYCFGNPLLYCVLVDGLWIDISGENYFEGKLEYVHQLQQALRLCGIEKEIIL